jgi:hypothetical protein
MRSHSMRPATQDDKTQRLTSRKVKCVFFISQFNHKIEVARCCVTLNGGGSQLLARHFMTSNARVQRPQHRVLK